MSPPEEAASRYFRALETVDPRAADDLVLGLLEQGAPVQAITTDVLAPAQVRVGHMWETGRWSVADEHVATSITERALASLTDAAGRRRTPHSRHVVVACAEGEWHTLPARMVATAAAASGNVKVTVLGPALAPEQVQHALSAGDVDLLALSCTMPPHLIGAVRCIQAAHELGVPVVVGGRALGDDPRRARAIGADGWGADAEVLLGPVPARTGRAPAISAEVLQLDAVDGAVISLCHDRVVAAFPRLPELPGDRLARTREDLGWMARYAAAALLTGDQSVVEDLLTWMCGRSRADVPTTVVTTSALVLADALEAHAPSGAAVLRDATAEVARGRTGPADASR